MLRSTQKSMTRITKNFIAKQTPTVLGMVSKHATLTSAPGDTARETWNHFTVVKPTQTVLSTATRCATLTERPGDTARSAPMPTRPVTLRATTHPRGQQPAKKCAKHPLQSLQCNAFSDAFLVTIQKMGMKMTRKTGMKIARKIIRMTLVQKNLDVDFVNS